jgi:hypothetical protein
VRPPILSTLALAASLTWASAAGATPDFPGVVVQTLGLTGITVGAPEGCTLCHTTNAGGPSLRAFGQLLFQDGTQPYNEGSLKTALAEVQLDEPALIADIKAGRDPNDDTSGLSSVETPTYGCATTPARAHASELHAHVGLALVALAWARGSRRRRAGRPPLPPRRTRD